jgi:hypothetical protein
MVSVSIAMASEIVSVSRSKTVFSPARNLSESGI